jgi:hypothetical protein
MGEAMVFLGFFPQPGTPRLSLLSVLTGTTNFEMCSDREIEKATCERGRESPSVSFFEQFRAGTLLTIAELQGVSRNSSAEDCNEKQ